MNRNQEWMISAAALPWIFIGTELCGLKFSTFELFLILILFLLVASRTRQGFKGGW